ncbi:lycopene cyclase family protein [Klenkia sp. PcliD-1-E]|uniref:lycopene cyclase family protein n=1 Tax=Klenkia sp. PcliD-1-E TaxID=2954492 RepID=UPI002097D4DE|nr:lycopene cyclase family protein [Klenkia sp. PcliD-1-E]MCO7219237.1 lycopene cyclase family protein [Klenkia sp. PcliD-1-E]
MPPGPRPPCDVVVAGAGPAGLAVAAACADRGLSVAVVAPSARPWTHTYGLWADELADAESALLRRTAGVRYPTTLVRTGAGDHDLRRAYARLDNELVHTALLDRVRDAGGELVTGRVGQVRDGRVAVLDDGTELTGMVVVDARGGGPGTTQQRAWGERVAGPVPDVVPEGGALLMDWPALRDPADPQPPAFLYGMGMDDGTVLLEATSLAGRPPVRLHALRDRLHAHLARHGLRSLGEPEKVAIPLDARPARSGGVPVGAAAGLVHPATGYSVATSLRLGPVVADAVVGGAGPAEVAALVRPRRLRATLGLLGLGREVLLGLDEADTDAFFQAFFTLPPRAWAAYLDVGSSPTAVAAAMLRVAAALPPAGRRTLLLGVVRALPRRAAGRAG